MCICKKRCDFSRFKKAKIRKYKEIILVNCLENTSKFENDFAPDDSNTYFTESVKVYKDGSEIFHNEI